MPEDLARMTASELAPLIAEGKVRAAEIADACLDAVEAREPEVRAWAFIDPANVRAQAAALDEWRLAGRPIGPLHGIPVGLKDIIDTEDMPTENGTVLDSGRRPRRDAASVSALRAAGAIVMGKTVTAELANRTPGDTRNPHDPARTPGGSSSGSAAAVAAAMSPLAVGTQTGGSVIRPASFCGVVRFKPTRGLLPLRGVFCRSHTLDTLGVFARSVDDVALIAEVLATHDPMSDLPPRPRPPLASVARTEPPLTPVLAMVKEPWFDRADADMQEAFAEVHEALGDIADEVPLPPPFAGALERHSTISLTELSKYMTPYLQRGAEALSAQMRGDVDEGRKISARDYLIALDWIEILNAGLDEIFERYDAIVTLAAPGQAPVGLGSTGDPCFNSLWTLCGTPAVTLPLLEGADGMPMGLQLVGPRNGDARLLRTANWLMRWLLEAD